MIIIEQYVLFIQEIFFLLFILDEKQSCKFFQTSFTNNCHLMLVF